MAPRLLLLTVLAAALSLNAADPALGGVKQTPGSDANLVRLGCVNCVTQVTLNVCRASRRVALTSRFPDQGAAEGIFHPSPWVLGCLRVP